MYCPRCGTNLSENTAVCPDCGYRFSGRRRSRWDRDRVIRCLIVLALVLALAGGGLLLFTRRSGGPNPAPPAATAIPTAVPMSIPTAVPTSVPTAVPTVIPTSAPTAVPTAVPLRSVNSTADAAALINWMVENNTLRVDLDALNITQEELSSATDCRPEVASWRFVLGTNAPMLELKLYAGAQVALACLNGDEASLDAELQGIARQARQVVDSLISPGMTDLEKETAIHDYIIYHADYAIDEARLTQDARGFFRYGSAQCSGYADTFYLLGALSGLEIRCVEGDIIGETGGHEWSLIRLDGLWYAVDVTWDDPVGGEETCAYLNIPHCFLQGDRTWNDAMLPEGAYAMRLDANNPYYRQGCIADTAAEAESLLRAQLASGRYASLCYLGGEIDIAGMMQSIAQSFSGAHSWSWTNPIDLPAMKVYEITFD